MGDTTIEWTDKTWNPVRGCSRVSDGCVNCYAEKVAKRFSGPGLAYEGLIAKGGQWNGKIKFVDEHIEDPLRWKKPCRIFVNSMSDLFHENVTDEQIDEIFGVMALASQHTFQILTKRPERMLAYMTGQYRDAMVEGSAQNIYHRRTGDDPGMWLAVSLPLPNVWLGVSVENQETADERIPLLLQTPAAIRFLSCEPLLGNINLQEAAAATCNHENVFAEPDTNAYQCNRCDSGEEIENIDWVIVGGESGPGARPMRPDWARSLRDQCKEAGTAFFFKQWGEWFPGELDNSSDGSGWCAYPDIEHDPAADCWEGQWKYQELDGTGMFRVGKKRAGSMLDGVEIKEFPTTPTTRRST